MPAPPQTTGAVGQATGVPSRPTRLPLLSICSCCSHAVRLRSASLYGTTTSVAPGSASVFHNDTSASSTGALSASGISAK